MRITPTPQQNLEATRAIYDAARATLKKYRTAKNFAAFRVAETAYQMARDACQDMPPGSEAHFLFMISGFTSLFEEKAEQL